MRRRLTLLVAATTSVVLLAFLIPLGLLVRTVAADRAVTGASEQAQALITVVSTGTPQTVRLAVEQATNGTDRPLTVFLPGGQSVGDPAERSAAVRLAETGRSLSVDRPDGREILVAVQAPVGPAVIRTFVPTADLSRGVPQAWLILAVLGVALMGVSLFVADCLARSLVRPIHALAAVSSRLADGDLQARAIPAGPAEIAGVGGALNRLAGRIRELLDAEREQVADLSHRLRTPLTTLRLEAEGLGDPDESERVTAAVDALEAAVTQTIADARRRGDGSDRRCDAAAVVAERVAFWSVLAEDTGRQTEVRLATGPLPVPVAAADLAACVDALLGNVFAHTPDGTAFSVTLTAGVELTIADRGLGFSSAADPAERGASGRASTGLGLDIARRTAQAAGGDLALGNQPGGGAVVRVRLPPLTAL
jgi:signal transduction histidine kinase